MTDQSEAAAPADDPITEGIVKWAARIGGVLTGLKATAFADALGPGWGYVIALAVAGFLIGGVVGYFVGRILAAIVSYARRAWSAR